MFVYHQILPDYQVDFTKAAPDNGRFYKDPNNPVSIQLP